MTTYHLDYIKNHFQVGEIYKSNVNIFLRAEEHSMDFSPLSENDFFIVLKQMYVTWHQADIVYLTKIMNLNTLKSGLLPIFHDYNLYRILERLDYSFERKT